MRSFSARCGSWRWRRIGLRAAPERPGVLAPAVRAAVAAALAALLFLYAAAAQSGLLSFPGAAPPAPAGPPSSLPLPTQPSGVAMLGNEERCLVFLTSDSPLAALGPLAADEVCGLQVSCFARFEPSRWLG